MKSTSAPTLVGMTYEPSRKPYPARGPGSTPLPPDARGQACLKYIDQGPTGKEVLLDLSSFRAPVELSRCTLSSLSARAADSACPSEEWKPVDLQRGNFAGEV